MRQVLMDHELTDLEREDGYLAAMAEWEAKSPEQAKRWVEVEWMSAAIFDTGTADFLAAKYLPTPRGNLRNAIIFRRAILYTLEAVETYRGEVTLELMEGGQMLLSMQFMEAERAPADLADRVALAVERLRGMDERDLAVLYREGAHWLINEFRTPEEMVAPLLAAGTELRLFPVMRPVDFSAGSTFPDPAALPSTP